MADAQDYIGRQIGEYHLLRQLGRGTFGVVYLGEHIHDQTQAAVKLLRLQLTRSLELKDFLNEARVIRLRHKHIIPILDFGISPDDMPFLVMEYAPGGTIRDRFWHGMSLPLPEIVAYTSQLASALQFAHSRRLIHRDVKPENMLLGSDGTVLLSDFGIAKMMEQSSTMSHQAQAGTPAYMAPEQGGGEPCPASDQYALAVVVYEWMASRRPFLGTPLEVALQHRLDPPPPLRTFRPGIPVEAEKVILKALAKSPDDRFETVEQFAQALQFAIDSSPTAKVPAFSASSTLSLYQNSSVEATASGLATTIQQSIENIDEVPTPKVGSTRAFTPLPDSQPAEPVEQIATELIEQDFDPASDPYRTLRWQGPEAVLQPVELAEIAPTSEAVQAPDPVNPKRQLIPKRFRIFPVFLTLFIVLCLGLSLLVLFLPMSGNHAVNTTNAQSAYNNAVATAGVMSGFNAQHSNTNPYEQSLNANNVGKLALKWNIVLAGLIESSPVIAGGLLYVALDNGRLYAFDALTGQQKWVASTTGSILHSSPAIVDGLVYIGSGDGKLYAFDALSGKKKWVATTGNAIYSSPTVANGLVYIGSTDKQLYAFNALTGQQKWVAQATGSLVSSPAVAANLVYIGSEDGKLYAFDALQGTLKWTALTGAAIEASPALANNLVYISSKDNHLYAFNALSGLLKWVTPDGNFAFSSPALANGLVYAGSQNSQLYAFDALSGQSRWSEPTGDFVKSPPLIANGLIYAGAQNSGLYAFDALSGKKAWSWSVPTGDTIESSPVIANGMVYATSQNGHIYSFSLK